MHRFGFVKLLFMILGPILLNACGGAAPVPPDAQTVQCAGPDAQSGLETLPDPSLPSQWHLQNTGQSGGRAGEDIRARAAWERLKRAGCGPGAGVRIAVLDLAVDLNHPDLIDNRATGLSYDYLSGWATEPLPRWNGTDTAEKLAHGTSVAGIIAARAGNSLGGAGVAPQAQLAGFNPLAGSPDRVGEYINDALTRNLESIDVYHNSWGSLDGGKLSKASAGFSETIERGLLNGRGGLGALYVFAAGNGGCLGYPSSNCRPDVDRSNYDGYLNHRGVIVACAFDHNGELPIWAERGSNLLACGPSGPARVLPEGNTTSAITTTALNGSMVSDFSNSSASAPMVSGVIALMLSANVKLSARDVRLILARSARRNDPLNPDWQAGRQGGHGYHPGFGFGAVDADAAVALARAWTSIGDERSLRKCQASSRTSESAAWSLAIPDNQSTGVSHGLNLDDSCPITRVEHVEIRLVIDHAYIGDLAIDLQSPAGTTSSLASQRDCGNRSKNVTDDCGSYNENWPIASVRHLDEPARGQWRLTIADRIPGKSGTLNAWQILVWGR